MAEFYTIRLINCAFFARHGLFEAEAQTGQRFYVDAVLTVRPDAPLDSDELAATVDYGAVYTTIEGIVTGTRRKLLETVAQEIGKTLIRNFEQIIEAEISIRKPAAPIPGVLDYAEITVITRA